jgi:hypothetical protein
VIVCTLVWLLAAGCSGWAPKHVDVPDRYSSHPRRSPAQGEAAITPVGLRQVWGGVWLDLLVEGQTERVAGLTKHYPIQVLSGLCAGGPALTISSSVGETISVKPGRTPGHVDFFPTRKLATTEPGTAAVVLGVPLRTTPRMERGRYTVHLVDNGRYEKAGIRLGQAEIDLQYVSEIGELFQRSPR